MALSMQSCLIVKFVAELTYFVGHDRNLPGVLRVGFCDVSVTTSGQAEHADSLLGNKSSCGTGRSLHATKRKTHERARLQDESGARAAPAALLREKERRRECDRERESFTDNASVRQKMCQGCHNLRERPCQSICSPSAVQGRRP